MQAKADKRFNIHDLVKGNSENKTKASSIVPKACRQKRHTYNKNKTYF